MHGRSIIEGMTKLSPTTKYLLKAFIPYTNANLKLAFKPSMFFRDLSQQKRLKVRSVESAYYRAIKSGLIEMDYRNYPRLTDKGRLQVKRFEPTELPRNAQLIIIFDIPEEERNKRSHLRTLLRELSFVKIQQSVWASRYDHRELINAEVEEYGLEPYVQIYEAVRL